MSMKELDQTYIAGTYGRQDVVFVRGEGCSLFDEDGKRYIDMGSGIAVNVFGHGDDAWVKAVTDQVNALTHVSNLYYTQPQAKLAKVLCESTKMKKVFFGNSGAEANECAIKVARKYACDRFGEEKRPVILTLTGSFHGRTMATLSATGQDVFHHTFGPFPTGFAYVAPGDKEALQSALAKGDVCAVLMEMVQGEGGVNVLDQEYVRYAYDLAHQHEALFMVDEVQTGNGRTGKRFSYEWFDIQPDVVTTAKGLAGGLPMGACLLGEAVAGTLTPSSHGSTFGGNPVCASGALCVHERLTDDFLSDVAKKSNYLIQALQAMDGVISVSGLGLMLGIETKRPAGELVKALLGRGVVTLTAKHKLRLLPPLTITKEELDEVLTILKEELQAC